MVRRHDFFFFLTCTHVHGNKTESASPAGGPPEVWMPYTQQMNKKKLQTSLLIWVSVKLQSHQTEAHKNDTLWVKITILSLVIGTY